MNTKNIEDKLERKKTKRESRKKAPAKPKRPSDVPRGSLKKKVQKAAKGQRRR